jgi:transposase IS116/IS110/IS902 family protein
VAGDTELAEGVKVLARGHQGLIWSRQRHLNQMRNALREFYPAALEAFGTDLASADALAVLGAAPTPGAGGSMSSGRIAAALKRGGRRRRIAERADEIRAALRSPQLEAPEVVSRAYGEVVRSTVRIVAEMTEQIDALARELEASFEGHPDAEILRSLPGLGSVLGARVLAEFGDDPTRYADPKARKNYAGTSPITKASGRSRVALARFARNRRLADALEMWAFCSLTASPGARRYYDVLRARGHSHRRALRSLANRWVGILHGCLSHRAQYSERVAWPTVDQVAA